MGGKVSSASVATSIRPTGSRMENNVKPKPGARKVAGSSAVFMAMGGGEAATRFTARRANIGPATTAVGMPTTKPQNSTSPIFAPSAVTATTGPGWGGITPCITDMQASRGMASFKKGCLVS